MQIITMWQDHIEGRGTRFATLVTICFSYVLFVFSSFSKALSQIDQHLLDKVWYIVHYVVVFKL